MSVSSRETVTSGRVRRLRTLTATALLASVTVGVSLAGAEGTTTPTTPTTTPVVAQVPQWVLGMRQLGVGAKGGDVKQLQRLLVRRGYRIGVDGAYGPQTRRAVRLLQRRMKMRKANGIATFAFLRRLGIRQIRSGLPVTPAPAPVPTGAYPLAGPGAANAKYLKAFPVGGKHYYFNDFGAPRSQGSHQGNDIMADRGLPVRAVADGTVYRLSRTETSLGGIWVWLRDTAGNEYYFAHLTTIPPEIQPGTRVKTGQTIGTVGNTGDARYGAPHLHFEIHPGGGGAVNPYTDLLAVDPEPPTRK